MKKSPLSQELTKEKIRLAGPHRWSVYFVSAILWISGLAWLCFKPLWAPPTQALDSPWPQLLMKLHGAAAMIFLILIGTLIVHVLRAWASGRNRLSGLSLLGSVLVLTATGWMLYYAGDESTRLVASYAHSAMGLALALILILHVIFGRRSR
jgi:hypothetical protein